MDSPERTVRGSFRRAVGPSYTCAVFGFGHGPELIIILVIALIVLGPGKIPEVAQMLGKGIRELRQASADLQKTFDVNELMNPSPAPSPPPAEAEAPMGSTATETILPPADPKPKRSRKRPAASEDVATSGGAPAPSVSEAPEAASSNGSRRPRRRASAATADLAVVAEASGTKQAVRRRPSKRPSKNTTETVSLDAPA